MQSRVFLLGELVILLYADYAALYSVHRDTADALAHLPRVGFAAALIWAILFFMADAGAGGVAALLGLLIVASFSLAYANLILDSFDQWLSKGPVS